MDPPLGYHNQGSLVDKKESLYANFINLYMALNRHQGSGTPNFLTISYILASLNLSQITHYLQKGSSLSFVALLVYVDDIIIQVPLNKQLSL